MAKKPTLSDITTNYTSKTTLNNNFNNIEVAFDNTLSRDGSGPNTMLASLDMNSQRILNLPAPTSDNEPLRKQDVDFSNISFETYVSDAQDARDAAQAALESFEDVYLGDSATDPTTDLDGGVLTAGMIYYNTTDSELKVYTGSVWDSVTIPFSTSSLANGDILTYVSANSRFENSTPSAAGLMTLSNNHTVTGDITFSGAVGLSGATLSLAAGEIDTADLANVSVTTAKIADDAVTEAKLATAVTPLGVGQTWTDVTASRSVGVTYTNSTGRPIMIYVLVSRSGFDPRIFADVGSLSFSSTFGASISSGTNSILYLLVPPGQTYEITSINDSLVDWYELR